MQLSPELVRTFGRVVTEQHSLLFSTLGLGFLPDVTQGDIGDLELALHGSHAVLFARSLR